MLSQEYEAFFIGRSCQNNLAHFFLCIETCFLYSSPVVTNVAQERQEVVVRDAALSILDRSDTLVKISQILEQEISMKMLRVIGHPNSQMPLVKRIWQQIEAQIPALVLKVFNLHYAMGDCGFMPHPTPLLFASKGFHLIS